MYSSVADLSSKWWTFLLGGVVALAVALYAFTQPILTVVALVYVLGAYFIISGVASLFAGFSAKGGEHWWALLIMGPLQIAIGCVAFLQPGIGVLSLALLFAVWLIMSGALQLSSAVALRRHVGNEFWSIVLGVITLGFGFYVVLVPGLSLFALVYTVAFYSLFAGISLIALAFRVRNIETAATSLKRAA